jgi:hypothetical protein|tara:strand:+ start:751 stop:888 length:138 start_codon:yes stop_codon:yes gene_type:complete
MLAINKSLCKQGIFVWGRAFPVEFPEVVYLEAHWQYAPQAPMLGW